MRWAAVVVAALALAAPAAAGTSVKIPAPAVGKIRVEMLTIKASSTPKVSASNLPALGKNFGGVAIVGKTKSGYVAFIVMFMGSSPSAPASSVDLQLSTGTPTGKLMDETNNCNVLKSIYDDRYYGLGSVAVLFKLDRGASPAKSESSNDLEYQIKTACK